MKKIVLVLILFSTIFYSCSSEDTSNKDKTLYKVEYYGSLEEGFLIDSNRNIKPKLVFDNLKKDDFSYVWISHTRQNVLVIETNSASFKFKEGTYKIIKK